MTIVTKPITEKKNEKPLQKPLVINGKSQGTSECSDHTVIDPSMEDVEAWLSSTARRRVSTATTICVFVTALLVMSIGIIGGVYLYRQFSQHQMNRFRGWCGIPYEKDVLGSRRSLPFGGKPTVYNGNEDAEWNSGNLFKEEFDLDLEGNSYEHIHVPNFEFGRQGRFIHDFKVNVTGIIDYSSQRCFVLPLDRGHVLPPRTMFDLIKKIWMGYYNVDTSVIRRTMRVTYPRVEDYEPLGKYIKKQCANFPTYILEVIKPKDLTKRSVDAQLTETKGALEFVEFAGNKIVQFTILDHELEGLQQQ